MRAHEFILNEKRRKKRKTRSVTGPYYGYYYGLGATTDSGAEGGDGGGVEEGELIPWPKGTVKVDVSDVYDWYKLGQHISNLKGLGKHDFGKGPPQTVMAFGSEPLEHEYIKDLNKIGLKTYDIDEDVTESKMAELDMDLEDPEISDSQFEKIYGMTRREARELFSKTNIWDFPQVKDPDRPLHEQDVTEGADIGNQIAITLKVNQDSTVDVTAMLDGEEVGYVNFDNSEGELIPQDLYVKPKYRGQGIAAAMYNYTKNKGYTILRGEEQSDDAIKLWNKHRPGQDIWEQGVAEGKQPGRPVVDAILKVMPAAQEIWFHGSRATGKHRRNSDIDILVVVPDNLVGDKYLGAVRILQKLNSHFENYDIQPTKTGTNIHRVAQEEGQLLWSKQGVAEAANPGTKKPVFSGWLAMTYQRENAGKKFPSNVRSKSGRDLNKIIPQDEFDINDIEIDDDSISLELSPLLYDNFRLSSTGGGAGQGFSEHFYQLPNVRGFNMALELGKRLLAGEAAIKRWFAEHNQSLRKIGLPEYRVECWGGITSPAWHNDSTSDVIADLDQLRAIYNQQAQLGDFWNRGTISESLDQGVAEENLIEFAPGPDYRDDDNRQDMPLLEFAEIIKLFLGSEYKMIDRKTPEQVSVKFDPKDKTSGHNGAVLYSKIGKKQNEYPTVNFQLIDYEQGPQVGRGRRAGTAILKTRANALKIADIIYNTMGLPEQDRQVKENFSRKKIPSHNYRLKETGPLKMVGQVATAHSGAKDVASRLQRGDYTGAGIGALSALANLKPGLGTAVSLGLDFINDQRDKQNNTTNSNNSSVTTMGTDEIKPISPEAPMQENFADGKNPGRKGLAKRMGVPTKASVTRLRQIAKNSTGEKQRMAHWLANMKAGKKK